jgi:esterase/lipase superfamily enzyme
MVREYHKRYSIRLNREMEVLVFGAAGLPVVAFPTSCGRFFDFEDRGMVEALSDKINAGRLQLFCVDSVDAESWYNRRAAPRWRITRQMQYEDYLIQELLPLLRQKNRDPRLLSLGCSFGGYHAVNERKCVCGWKQASISFSSRLLLIRPESINTKLGAPPSRLSF